MVPLSLASLCIHLHRQIRSLDSPLIPGLPHSLILSPARTNSLHNRVLPGMGPPNPLTQNGCQECGTHFSPGPPSPLPKMGVRIVGSSPPILFPSPMIPPTSVRVPHPSKRTLPGIWHTFLVVSSSPSPVPKMGFRDPGSNPSPVPPPAAPPACIGVPRPEGGIPRASPDAHNARPPPLASLPCTPCLSLTSWPPRAPRPSSPAKTLVSASMVRSTSPWPHQHT